MITPRGKWKVAVVAGYLTAIFAAGMISGWVVAGREAKTNPHLPHPPGPGPGPRMSSINQVPLRPDQKSQVDEILARYSKKMEALREKQMSEMRKESSNRNVELSAVLTPDQREQWEKIRKDRDAAWRSGTNSWRGGSNSPRGSSPGDKGDRGARNRGSREKRTQESTNSEGGRRVTSPTDTQSTTPPAPPR